ncbi:HPr Serine kinase C-terminal domain-containing protein [Lentibacillus persicus]|uniref:HPr Serine kinase C-terminal domain-containing protein n=1 Tax=Lentibacillus persicus TaxID=640948 RepID=A0A1I1UFF9_9BACI|nr:aldolase [Lentibacillus persicus]SFD66690.1 HPr Serine kinase C-terminal domain-containing protein [Lentibacillus persicus]
MIETAELTAYTAFGLTIASDHSLPELNRVNYKDCEVDLIIRREDLSHLWLEYAEADTYYYIKENLCMVRVPDVAIYKIENGREISVSPFEEASDEQIRLYLLGTCLGAALIQRKVLPLHGSCIAIDGKAYAIVGDSGAGKSTLASAFINRGFQLLSDDVIAVMLTEDHHPMVIPSYPQQKLWQESLDQFGMTSSQYKPIYDRETKFAIPVASHFHDKPMPLAGVFELNKSDLPKLEIAPVQTLERFPVLYYNTYRHFMISRSGLMEWHFELSARMVNRLDFYRVFRPNSRFTAYEIVEGILDLINKGEKNI